MRSAKWTGFALLLFFQQLPGTPWTRHTIDRSSRGADGVKLADVNGDGLPDLTTGWEEGGRVRLYLNPGRRAVARPWPAVTVGRVGSPEDAVPVDLDRDGAVDVVSACEGSTRAVFVHWAPRDRRRYLDDGAWSTVRLPAAPGGRSWMQVLPMDIDGRHGPDLLVGARGDGALVGWLAAPPDPRDPEGWRFHPLLEAGWVMSLLARDVDGDGDQDVVVSDRRGEGRGVFWLENPGAEANRRGEPWRRHAIGAAGREVMFLDLADLDGDGRQEVMAVAKPTEVVVLRQGGAAGDGWLAEAFRLDPEGIGTVKAVRAADLDLDGRRDLVFSFEEAVGRRSGLAWGALLPGRPAAVGALRDIAGPEGVKFDLIGLVDLDADGDLDLLSTEEVEGLGVVWYENPAR